MSSDALKAVLKDTIREGAESAAKKGITQATEDALEKSLQDTLRNTAADGFQKSVKDAIEKNLDVDTKLTEGSNNIKKNLKADANEFNLFKDRVYNKLDAKIKKTTPNNDVFKTTLTSSIDDIDLKQTMRNYADKPKMGKIGADGDFKVDNNTASGIKKEANALQNDLDTDPEYKQKSVAERQADFDKLKSGNADLDGDAKLKQGVKGQGRGLFKSSVKAAGLAIAGITFFAWANKRANAINSWNGNCSSIEKTSDNKLIFDVDNFPEDNPVGCDGRKFKIQFSGAAITFKQNGNNIFTIPANGCVAQDLPSITSTARNKFIVPINDCPQCLKDGFQNQIAGVYNVEPGTSIFLKCSTTVGTEAGCIIKEYGLEPLNDLFGGLGLGKIIRTILIVIGVVILAIVIFKIIGFIKNRD